MSGFPITGITGTTHTIGDVTWEWNGYAWELISTTEIGATGPTGPAGTGVSGATLSNYELILTFTNGTTYNVGYIRGETGPTGAAGSGGGGAAGTKTYAIFTPLDNEPPSTNFATLDTVNSISVLDFDGTTQESAIFRSMIPEGASFSTLLATLYFTASTATGGVVWGVQYEKLIGGGITGDRFTGGITGLATLTGATSTPVGITLSSSSYGGLTVGDPYRVKIYRDATNAADGMGGDAELLIVEIRGA